MHTQLINKFQWYKHWHEQWIHGPTHWAIFACAVFVAMLLFTYASSAGSGAGVVATY